MGESLHWPFSAPLSWLPTSCRLLQQFCPWLENQTAAYIVNLLKTVFSEHGIPAYVLMDQGRHFQEFTRYYQLEIFPLTTRFPQSSGFIEAMVNIVKHTMRRAEQSQEGPPLAKVAYRVTPRCPGKISLAEAMNHCKFRVLLPIKQNLSAKLTTTRETMLQQRQQQAENYNHAARTIQRTPTIQPVQLQLDPG